MKKNDSKLMKICHLSTEFTPFVKAGGLADIALGLSTRFHQMGHFVRVMLPYFSSFEEINPRVITDQFECSWGEEKIACRVLRGLYQGVELILIDPLDEEWSFDGKPIYGTLFDPEKFSLFSLLCIEYLQFEKLSWDIVHCHDWVTSLAVLLLKEKSFAKTLLTIHNASYQGIFSSKLIDLYPLKSAALKRSLLEEGRLNLLKGGILNAGKIVTVSPTYREELLTPQGAKNLLPHFLLRESDFYGILNGLDDHFWNPSCDPILPCHFDLDHLSIEKVDQILLWKRLIRQFLHTDLGLTTEGPLLISIGRLVEQKSPDLLIEAGRTILANGGVFVLLGSTHDQTLEEKFKAEFPPSSRCHLHLGFDERLSHLLYAAADLIAVPSRFEPCGLTQMIAMRYGAIPVVRKIGGLADTVFDVETSQVEESKRCGFTFDHDNVQGLHWGLDRALKCYFENRSLWEQLIVRCMSQDFSWNAPSLIYQQLYESLFESAEELLGEMH